MLTARAPDWRGPTTPLVWATAARGAAASVWWIHSGAELSSAGVPQSERHAHTQRPNAHLVASRRLRNELPAEHSNARGHS